jgi:hypothetical protein
VYDAPQIKADRRPSALSVFEKSWPLQDAISATLERTEAFLQSPDDPPKEES